MLKISFLLFLGASLCLLSACGKKGDPFLAPGQGDEFPGQYPKNYD